MNRLKKLSLICSNRVFIRLLAFRKFIKFIINIFMFISPLPQAKLKM